MKKLIILFLFLFLAGCSKEAVPEKTVDTEKIVSEALALHSEGQLTKSLETALAVYENTDAQRIIADVCGAYSCADKLFTKKLSLPEEALQLAISKDGNKVVATGDSKNYLIDYNSTEIIKELPGGRALIENNTLYIEGQGAFSLVDGSITEALKNPFIAENGVLDSCEKDGIVYKVMSDSVTNGEWTTELEILDGYLNIFPLVHDMYNTNGEVVDYDSIVIANGNRLTALDRSNGEKVFETTLKDPIISCEAGDKAVIISWEKAFSSSGQLFSNKANNPQLPQVDTLRLGNSYSFENIQNAIVFSNERIVSSEKGTKEMAFLYKVSYDLHPKLTLEERYPTAIANKDNLLAMGTYEYVDKVRYNYFVLYNLDDNTYTKTPIKHKIDKITYADGWQIMGDGEITAIDGVAFYKHEEEITVDSVLVYKGKTITFDTNGTVSDSLGNKTELGFELSDLSTFSYADENTLFITEYENCGKSVLLSLDDMKIKAKVENGIFFLKDAKAILYRKGSQLGIYKYLTPLELKKKGEEFLNN